MTLSKDEGFVLWLALATIVHGWTCVEQSHNEEGMTEMRRGLAAYRATGARLAHTYILALLAEGCAKSARSDEALLVLGEAMEACNLSGERVFEAELHRLKGELIVQISRDKPVAEAQRSGAVTPVGHAVALGGGLTEAESCFITALDIARSQGAKAFELRAAMGLGRLWRAQGRREDARRVLAETYGSFVEGFDTRDLREARMLLDELA
jgi:predicted ATPase